MTSSRSRLRIPPAFSALQSGPEWTQWLGRLPSLATESLDRWDLTVVGEPVHGFASLVLPVDRLDGSAAMLKLQQVDYETAGEPLALRAWAAGPVVDLLEYDQESGTLLLEKLDPTKTLEGIPDSIEAITKLSELIRELSAVAPPAGLRRLAGVAQGLLERSPGTEELISDSSERSLLRSCVSALQDVMDEPGDKLLHWDLHYANVLAPLPGSKRKEPWIVIDPKPLVGDPGFELMPGLCNRWGDITSSTNIQAAVKYRFDLMTEVVGVDRGRAHAWTLARVLQNAIWATEDGSTCIPPDQSTIARALLNRV